MTTWEATYTDSSPIQTPAGEIVGYTAMAEQPDGRRLPAAGMTITAGGLQIAMPLSRQSLRDLMEQFALMADRMDQLGRRANIATITDHKTRRRP